MTFGDFGFGVLASWLANQIGNNNQNTQKIKSIVRDEEINQIAEDTQDIDHSKQLFKTYDIYHDLDDILIYLNNPVAQILVEKTPSNFYNLTSVVIESKTTNEWFVFNRGRTSFQGTGGGIRQSKDIIEKFRNEDIEIGTWAIDIDLLNSFESGDILWQDIKNRIIPLMSSITDQSDWKFIQDEAKTILNT